jgi:hypothetical protein
MQKSVNENGDRARDTNDILWTLQTVLSKNAPKDGRIIGSTQEEKG